MWSLRKDTFQKALTPTTAKKCLSQRYFTPRSLLCWTFFHKGSLTPTTFLGQAATKSLVCQPIYTKQLRCQPMFASSSFCSTSFQQQTILHHSCQVSTAGLATSTFIRMLLGTTLIADDGGPVVHLQIKVFSPPDPTPAFNLASTPRRA